MISSRNWTKPVPPALDSPAYEPERRQPDIRGSTTSFQPPGYVKCQSYLLHAAFMFNHIFLNILIYKLDRELDGEMLS